MKKKDLALVLAAGLIIISIVSFQCVAAPTAPPAPQESAVTEAAAEKPAEEMAKEEPTSAPAPAPEEQEEKLEIYLVVMASCSWDPFWCIVDSGIEDAAAALNVNVTRLAPSKWDPEEAAANIDRAIAANPDGIGVTVIDGALFEEPMMRAIDAGIPVIAYDTADMRPKEERIPYITFIGSDEYLSGYRAADRLFKAHGGTAGVCVNHSVGHGALDARCRGFVDRLSEEGIPAQVLATTEDAAESTTIMGDFYTANPDVDIWYTLGPLSANPFYAFMENAGLQAGDIYHGTNDLTPEISENIKDGTTDFAIDSQPYVVGYLTVAWLTWINRYGLYPASEITATGPGFIDKSNIDLVSELAGTYR